MINRRGSSPLPSTILFHTASCWFPALAVFVCRRRENKPQHIFYQQGRACAIKRKAFSHFRPPPELLLAGNNPDVISKGLALTASVKNPPPSGPRLLHGSAWNGWLPCVSSQWKRRHWRTKACPPTGLPSGFPARFPESGPGSIPKRRLRLLLCQ